jgi:uncharacterized protein (DUF952 family)
MKEFHADANLIFKIVARQEWAHACAEGTYFGSVDDRRDGFIHFSAGRQLRATAAKHFRGKDGLLLVAYDPTPFGGDLKWEISRGGDLFPHLYAGLPTHQALWTISLKLGKDGVPILPEDLNAC